MALRYGSDNPESEAFVRRAVEADRRPERSSRKHVLVAVGASVLAGAALLAFQSDRNGTASLRAEAQNPAPSNLAANFDISSYEVPYFLRGDPEIVISMGYKQDLCMDDGGARKGALSTFMSRACNPTSVNQVFVFDEHNLMLKSAKKPNLCLSDGGATNPGDGPVHMDICDPSSADQRFIYDEGGIQFRNPLKDLCLDDGGAIGASYKMEKCNADNQDQVFTILWQNERGGPVDEYKEDDEPSAPTGQEVNPIPTDAEPTPTEGVSEPTATMGEPQPTEGEPVPTYGEPETESPAMETMNPGENGAGVPPMDEMDDGMTGTEESKFETPEDIETHEPFLVGENGAGVLDRATEEPRPIDPLNPNPKFTDFNLTDDEGDWNLLAPSDDTLRPVNADSSDAITADEIYAYLLGIKTQAEKEYTLTMSKYRRTYKCVTDGLQALAKTSLSTDEYHALVRWMYEHCAVDGPVPGPEPIVEQGSGSADSSSGSGSANEASSSTMTPGEIDRVYMTKLEFYQEIKDHFEAERNELFTKAEGTNLRSEVATALRKKTLACIEEASNRFGRDKEYELAEHFHNAILWINNECMNAV